MGDLDPHVYAVAEEAFKRMERYLWGTLMTQKTFPVDIEFKQTSLKFFFLDTRKTNQSLSLESQVQVKQSVPSTLCDILLRLEGLVMEAQTMERVRQTLSAAFWHHLQSWKQLEMQRQLEMITRPDLENIQKLTSTSNSISSVPTCGRIYQRNPEWFFRFVSSYLQK